MEEQIIKFLYTFVQVISEVLFMLIFIRVIFSWFRPKPNKLVFIVNDVTNPLMKLARKILPPIGMLDLSPIVAFFIVRFGQMAAFWLIGLLATYII